jgi:hypothetical protein
MLQLNDEIKESVENGNLENDKKVTAKRRFFDHSTILNLILIHQKSMCFNSLASSKNIDPFIPGVGYFCIDIFWNFISQTSVLNEKEMYELSYYELD